MRLVFTRLPAVALGVFVGWEFLYVPLSCMLEMIPQSPPVARAREGMERWSELTGHVQSWNMFSTGNLPAAVFLETEIRFPNGEVATVRSPFEPADPGRAYRPPIVYNRMFNYEMRIGLMHQFMIAEEVQKNPNLWQKSALDFIRENNWYMRAYLRTVWAEYKAGHPAAGEPAELVLKARQFRSASEYDSPAVVEPVVWPCVRWLPARADDPAFLPVEAYDPVRGQFVRLPAEERP